MAYNEDSQKFDSSQELTIGVLALQGAFSKHLTMLSSLGVKSIPIRKPEELEKCDGLLIPGGESTTILRQMQFIGFLTALQNFGKHKPIFGTCAGLILLSKEIINDSMKPFGFLDIKVERNAFGTQVESFISEIPIDIDESVPKQLFKAVFIRAPRIRSCSSKVKILAKIDGEAALVEQGNILGAIFHPELTEDSTIHLHFINMVKKCRRT